MRQEFWDHLGLEPTEDVSAIRSAYARRLKVTRPEDDPEGFQRLRLAYEQALAIARNAALVAQGTAGRAAAQSPGDQPLAAPPALPADAPTAPAPPNAVSAPGAPPATAPPNIRLQAPPPNTPPRDLELEAAAAAFQALHAALIGPQAPAEADLNSLLNSLLTSPVLERIAARQQLELALAGLLASTAPRSDVVLEPAIQRFGWHDDERALRSQPAIRAILTRRREMDFLEQLRPGKSDLALAYAMLRFQPNPIARTLRAYWTGAARSGELRLLALLRDRYPGLIATLNASEVSWWERFAKRPRLNFGLSRLAIGVLQFVGMLAGIAVTAGKHLTDELRIGGWFLAGLFGLLLSKLFIIDWPTLYIHRRWGKHLPIAAQVAWLPILCALLMLTAFVPARWIPTWPVAIAGITCCLWAIYVSGPHPTVFQRNWRAVTTSHVGRLVYLNLGLGAWWLFTLNLLLPLDLDTVFGAALALMAASAFGLTPLSRLWFGRVSGAHRLRWIAVLALAALGTAVLFFETGKSAAWQPFLAVLVTLIVVLHRVPCLTFTKAQSIARSVAFWACLLALDNVAAAETLPLSSDLFRFSGQLFMVLTCINLAIAFFNDRLKQQRTDNQ